MQIRGVACRLLLIESKIWDLFDWSRLFKIRSRLLLDDNHNSKYKCSPFSRHCCSRIIFATFLLIAYFVEHFERIRARHIGTIRFSNFSFDTGAFLFTTR